MDYQAAIMQRISRRSYTGAAIAEEKRAVLLKKIDEINAESGLQIAWLEDGAAAFARGKSYGMFSGVRTLLLLKGTADLPHLREKVGYYGEALILAATALGLGTCWVGGTFDKTALAISVGEELVAVVPVGAVAQKSTVKERLIRGLIHRKTKPIEALLRTSRPVSAELQRAMELVQRAPTTRNTQKVTFTVEKEITAHVPDDYHFDLVDLGICKLHFECGFGGRFAWGNGKKLVQQQ